MLTKEFKLLENLQLLFELRRDQREMGIPTEYTQAKIYELIDELSEMEKGE